MTADTRKVDPVEVVDELYACPKCDYKDGFHVAFVREEGGESLRLELICPSCSARFNLNRHV